MKNVNTSRAGHPPSRNTPVPVSKSKAKSVPKADLKIVVTPRHSSKLHPAEAAGMAVHQAVETGVVAVKDTVFTAASYIGNFVKGVVKGH